MTVTTLGVGRRVGAIAVLKLARLVLRGSMVLYQRHVMPRFVLRSTLSVISALEQAGALFALGRRNSADRPSSNGEDSHDRVD